MRFLILLLSFWFIIGSVLPVFAANAVVHAVLFFSPTCPHCHKVMTEDLPPLQERYGDQLQIAEINVLEPEGQKLYSAAVTRFQIPPDRRGVPTLIVGDQVLVGDREIPDRFPRLIDEGLAAGGIDWPDIPGFKPPAGSAPAGALSLRERLALDPAGNAIAIIVLMGMLVFTAWIVVQGRRLWRSSPQAVSYSQWRIWVVPVLSLIGLAVAAYLSYVELTRVSAVCGPIGRCNAVQESPYARLFGAIPIGVLGIAGYVAILVAWAVEHWGQEKSALQARLALLILTAFGTLFSIYLTFLEPFVIGASCLWCITSAVVMTALLGLSWRPGLVAWLMLRPRPSRRSKRRRAPAR